MQSKLVRKAEFPFDLFLYFCQCDYRNLPQHRFCNVSGFLHLLPQVVLTRARSRISSYKKMASIPGLTPNCEPHLDAKCLLAAGFYVTFSSCDYLAFNSSDLYLSKRHDQICNERKSCHLWCL